MAESGGAKGSPPGIVVFSEQATELAKGLRWVGVERGQGGDPPPSITSNSGAESERRDGIGRTQSHPPEICLLVSVGRRIKGVIAICRFFEGSGEKNYTTRFFLVPGQNHPSCVQASGAGGSVNL